MKKTICLILAVLMLFSLFAGCGKKDETKADTTSNSGSTSSGDSGKTGANTDLIKTDIESMSKTSELEPSNDAVFKLAVGTEPASLINMVSGSGQAQACVELMWEQLIAYDNEKNEFAPALITEWEWIDDVTLRCKLRDDVYSHAGDHMTASDVVFSLQWGYDSTKTSNYYGNVLDMENTKVVDDYTVDIAMKVPTPFFLYDLVRAGVFNVAVEASVDKVGGKDSTAVLTDTSSSTGPYKLVEWKKGEYIKLERNEEYWGKLPYYKYYEIYFINDANSRSMGVESGDFDACMGPTLASTIAAMNGSTIEGWMFRSYGQMNMVFNSDNEHLSVKELRQAIALAVNYEAVNNVCYSSTGTYMDGIFPTGLAWHSANKEDNKEYYNYYDPARAKEKLVEAGYADGVKLRLTYSSANSAIRSAAEVINNNLSEIGIELEIFSYEAATFSSATQNGDYDIILAVNPGSTPKNSVNKVNPSLGFGNGNLCGTKWCEGFADKMAELCNNCLQVVEMKEAYPYFEELQNIVREYVPFVGVLEYPGNFITAKDVRLSFEGRYGGGGIPVFYPVVDEAK